jgi:hypothetical protein
MKIYDSLTFPTMSNPNLNNALFASASTDGNTLYWRRSDGTVYDLARIDGSIVLTELAGPVTDLVYNRPINLKYIKIIAVGAGGGGGSGGAQSPIFGFDSFGNLRFPGGGGGGGGGAIVYAQFAKQDLSSTCYINIGAGGQGGTSVITSSGAGQPINASRTIGNKGQNGENTSFRKDDGTILVLAEGGKGGYGGQFTPFPVNTTYLGAYGGSTSASIPPYSPFSLTGTFGGGTSALGAGQNGGGNVFIVTRAGTGGGAIQTGCVAGGGAGGGGAGTVYPTSTLTPTIGTPRASGTGSGVTTINGVINGGNPGTIGTNQSGSDGANNVGFNFITHFPIEFNPTTYGVGCGGGGGGGGTGSLPSSGGGKGGNGGLYGAGGGGGGPGNPISFIGGSGSAGLMYLIEYF